MTGHWVTGKRKNAIARVGLVPGSGKILINGRVFLEFFPRQTWQAWVLQPFVVTETQKQYDVVANICGGGLSGQAGALRHGIAKALQILAPQLRAPLKQAGLLTRDPRIKERKKPGQKGARKRFQFSKR